MTIKEQLNRLNISEVEWKILDHAVDNYATHCYYVTKESRDSLEAKKFYDYYLEDISILENLRPFIAWNNIVYDLKRQMDAEND